MGRNFFTIFFEETSGNASELVSSLSAYESKYRSIDLQIKKVCILVQILDLDPMPNVSTL